MDEDRLDIDIQVIANWIFIRISTVQTRRSRW